MLKLSQYLKLFSSFFSKEKQMITWKKKMLKLTKNKTLITYVL